MFWAYKGITHARLELKFISLNTFQIEQEFNKGLSVFLVPGRNMPCKGLA